MTHNFHSLKANILSIFLLLPFLVSSQIVFENERIPIARLNSPEGQNYLVLSPFENALAFTEERGGVQSDQEVYKTYKRDILEGQWDVFIFSDWLNEKGLLSPIGFDKNGWLYYSETIYDKGVYQGVVRRAKNGKTEDVVIPFFKNKSPIQSGCINSEGQIMILSLESNNTKGVEDLYVTRKNQDGTWSSLINLGENINTAFQEITPFLSSDNRTLYFATNGRGGVGSFDIFYSVRQDNSWRNWSAPIALGTEINSSGAETSFSIKDQWAYFVSSQDSDGYGDIMQIKIKDLVNDTTRADSVETVDVGVEDVTISLNEEPVDVGVEEVTISLNEEPVDVGVPEVTVEVKEQTTLKIIDPETGQILSSELIREGEKRFSQEGTFSIDSITNEEVEIKSQGYLPKLVMLSDLSPGENIIEMASVSVGHVIQLDHVLFHRGTANMVDGSQKELDLVVEVMNDNPDMKILLKGHTDNVGDQVVNRRLSEARVKTVREYLLDQGINAFRIRGKGYGGLQPIESNATEETRKLNRRVEFEVIKQ